MIALSGIRKGCCVRDKFFLLVLRKFCFCATIKKEFCPSFYRRSRELNQFLQTWKAFYCFTPKLCYLLITHLNWWSRRQHFSCWSPFNHSCWSCFGFFVCPCYGRRTHYPMLEKPGTQNIVVCENQGKQHK